jgi:hypothetical protein
VNWKKPTGRRGIPPLALSPGFESYPPTSAVYFLQANIAVFAAALIAVTGCAAEAVKEPFAELLAPDGGHEGFPQTGFAKAVTKPFHFGDSVSPDRTALDALKFHGTLTADSFRPGNTRSMLPSTATK